MSWDSYENKDGTVTLCRTEWDESWGNWGEVILTKEELTLWRKGDKRIRKKVEEGLK